MSNSSDERRDRGAGIIAAAIVGAALILSWGMGRSEPRYQLASAGDSVVRMDTDSGELIACNAQRCSKIEQASRARTFGPLTVEVGDDAEKKAPAAPAN
jgi:hypothetical protein